MTEPSPLAPITALGGAAPGTATHGAITIVEDPNVAIASLAARRDGRDAVAKAITQITGAPPPGPGRIAGTSGVEALWTGPGQWFLIAPHHSRERIADDVKAAVGPAGSVTEQSDGWTCLRLDGAGTAALLERLCMLDIATAETGFAARTLIHHVSCFVIRDAASWRLIGPRSSAGSLLASIEAVARGLARRVPR